MNDFLSFVIFYGPFPVEKSVCAEKKCVYLNLFQYFIFPYSISFVTWQNTKLGKHMYFLM